jgi:proteasome lid subunit RPN8/RPN11
MRIKAAEAEAIQAHAREGYPFEVCGVFLARREAPATVVRAVRAVNRETEQPRIRYQIAPEDQLAIGRQARAEGLEVVGYYHSHPDHPARPSETDRRVAAGGFSDGVYHVVIGTDKGVHTTPTAWVFREATQAFEPEPFEIE